MGLLDFELYGTKWKNPVVVASATPTGAFKGLKKSIESGAGGVVVKSVSDVPALRSYIRPRFTLLHGRSWPHCFSNYSSEFAAWQDPDEFMRDLKMAMPIARDYSCIMIGSIFGGLDFDNWVDLARRQEDLGVKLIELDLGCPNTTGSEEGYELGNNPKRAADLTAKVVENVKLPVFVKLTSEGVDPLLVAKKCKEAGALGFTVLNRTPSLDIDIELGRPLLGGGYAGVGGPWMRPIMLKWVLKTYTTTGLPISATSGIWTWEDVVKAIMCGATTVQTCTAIMYGTKGYGIVRDFVVGLEKYLKGRGIKNFEDIKGITAKQVKTFLELERLNVEDIWAEVDLEACNGCKLCQHWCYYDAITFRDDDKAVIDGAACDGCGLCVVLCPPKAIELKGKGPFYLGEDYKKKRTIVEKM